MRSMPSMGAGCPELGKERSAGCTLRGEKETERCFAIYVLSFRALALSAYGQHSGDER